MTKKDQIEFLNKLYDDLTHFEEEGGRHKPQELLYLRNAINSVDVLLRAKEYKKNKKKKPQWNK